MLPSLATLPTAGLYQSKQALLLDDGGGDDGDVPMGHPVPVLAKKSGNSTNLRPAAAPCTQPGTPLALNRN